MYFKTLNFISLSPQTLSSKNWGATYAKYDSSFPTYVGENYINNEGCSHTLRQIKRVFSGQNEHITSTSATKLTPQATQQNIIDPISSSKYCQRTKEIQEYQRRTSTFRELKSIKINVLTDPLKSKYFNQFR